MPTIDELILRVKYDIQKGGIEFASKSLGDYAKAADQGGKAVTDLEKKVRTAEMTFGRQQKALNNAREAIVKSQLAFTGLGGAIGGVTGQIFNVTNQVEQFEYVARRSGQSVDLFSAGLGQASGAIGLLGTASLVAGAAIAGWKIGTWIAEVTGLGKAVEETASAMIDMANAARDVEAAQRQLGLNVDLGTKLMDKYNLSTSEFSDLMDQFKGNTSAVAGFLREQANAAQNAGDAFANQYTKALEESNKAMLDVNKTSVQLRDEANKVIDELSQIDFKDLTAAQKEQLLQAVDDLKTYGVAAIQEEKRAQEERTKASLSGAEKRAKIAAEEAKKTIDAIKIVPEFIAGLAPGLNASQTALTAWSEAFSKSADSIKEVQVRLEDLAPAQLTTAEYFAKQAEESGKLTETLSKTTFTVDLLGNSLIKLANGLSILGNSIGGIAGKLINSFADIAGSFKGIKDSFTTGFADIGKGGFSNIPGGLGSIAGGIGTAISLGTQLIGVFKELFGRDWFAATSKTVTNFLGGLQISKDLMQQIADQAKEMGSEMRAALINLPAIFDELGVSVDNFFQLAQSAQDVLSGIEQGLISTAEASNILNEVLPQLFEAAIEGGDAFMQRMQELLQMTQQFGIDISAVTDIIRDKISELQSQLKDQANTLFENLGPLIEDLTGRIEEFWNRTGPVSKEALTGLENQARGYATAILDTFNALKLAGATTAEAVAAVMPNIDQLKEALAGLGLKLGDVGLGFIAQMGNIAKLFPAQVGLINNVTASLQAMLAAGIEPSEAAFRAMQKSAMDAFNQINKDGKVSKAEIESIRPLLIQLAAGALQWGTSLSPATIELLKQAGLWDDIAGKPDATKVQQQGIGDLISALTKDPGGLIPTLQSFIDMLIQLNGMVVNTTVNTEFTTTGDPPDKDYGGNWTAGGSVLKRQGLRGMEVVEQASQLYLLHKGEKILGNDVPVVQANRNISESIRPIINVTVNVNGSAQMNKYEFQSAVEQAVINGVNKAGSLSNLRRR